MGVVVDVVIHGMGALPFYCLAAIATPRTTWTVALNWFAFEPDGINDRPQVPSQRSKVDLHGGYEPSGLTRFKCLARRQDLPHV